MHPRLAPVLAALSLVVGLAATASAASAGTVTVTPSGDLTDGQQVSVTAAGYAPADNPIGMYAAQVAIVGGTVHSNTASYTYVPSIAATGGFTQDVTVNRTFTSGATTIDCLVTQCQIAVWRAHGNPLPPGSTPQDGPPQAWPISGGQDIAFQSTTTVTVRPTTDLDPAGTTVTVEGQGFDPAVNADGLYVAQVTRIGGVRYAADAQWVTPAGTFGPQLNADGSFTATVNAAGSGTFSTGGPSGTSATVDCTDPATPCAIETWAAHADGVPDWRSRTALTFAGPGGDPGPGGGGGGGAFGLAVAPSTGLPTTGPSTLTVTGAGYSPSEPGIYVVYGPLAGRSDPGAYYGGAQWLHVAGGTLSAAGTFTTTVAVAPAYTDANGNAVNCTVVQCYVQTMRAHGQTDVNQDFAVPVSFASALATPAPSVSAGPAPGAAAADQAPGAPTTSASSSGPAAAPVLGTLRVGRGGRVRLTVSERSTVTFVLRRKARGAWRVVKVVRVRTRGAGTVGAALPLRRPGRYRISVKAVSSETGKASRKVVKRVTVKPSGPPRPPRRVR
jgi:hypothetical protein